MAEQNKPGFWGRFAEAVGRLFGRRTAAERRAAEEHDRRMKEMQDEHRRRWNRGARRTDGRLG